MSEVILRTDHHLVELNEDGTVTEWRTGERGKIYASLQEYYMSLNSPTARWAAHCFDKILAPGAEIIDGLTTAARLAQASAAEIEATPPGELVPNTALTREEADELMALAAHVLAFVNTPISEGGPTPSEVISRFK
jgi:hypothetical protein